MNFTRKSEDGKYGLTGPDDHGYYTLWQIVTDPAPEDWDHDLCPWGDIELGAVMDPENFETAIDAAEEEMRCLMADAREEFGF